MSCLNRNKFFLSNLTSFAKGPHNSAPQGDKISNSNPGLKNGLYRFNGMLCGACVPKLNLHLITCIPGP